MAPPRTLLIACGALAREVRAQLDGLGATETRIVVTSDLDEHAIAALAARKVSGKLVIQMATAPDG